MVDYLISISSDVVANMVIASTVLIGIAAYHLPRRKKMRRFFGLDRGAEVQIVLSNIWVEKSRGVTAVSVGHLGSAGSLGEYLSASALARTVERDSGVPRVLQFFVNTGEDGSRRYGRARVEIRMSPRYVDDSAQPSSAATFAELPAQCRKDTVDLLSGDRTVILAGSQVYNAAVLYMSEAIGARPAADGGVSLVRSIVDGGVTRSVVRIGTRELVRGAESDPAEEYQEYFIVRRVKLPHTVFLCSGMSTVSTGLALRALSDWAELAEEVGQEPFVAVYEVSGITRQQANDEKYIDVAKVRRLHLAKTPDAGPAKAVPRQSRRSVTQHVENPVEETGDV